MGCQTCLKLPPEKTRVIAPPGHAKPCSVFILPCGETATSGHLIAPGGLVCVPHPFDRFRRSPLSHAALERIAGGIHAIEGLNARNLASTDDRKAQRWAAEHAVPVVAGSDAHTYCEVGRARTELPAFDSAATLRQALPHARFLGGHSSPAVHLVTAVRKRLPRNGKPRIAGARE